MSKNYKEKERYPDFGTEEFGSDSGEYINLFDSSPGVLPAVSEAVFAEGPNSEALVEEERIEVKDAIENLLGIFNDEPSINDLVKFIDGLNPTTFHTILMLLSSRILKRYQEVETPTDDEFIKFIAEHVEGIRDPATKAKLTRVLLEAGGFYVPKSLLIK